MKGIPGTGEPVKKTNSRPFVDRRFHYTKVNWTLI